MLLNWKLSLVKKHIKKDTKQRENSEIQAGTNRSVSGSVYLLRNHNVRTEFYFNHFCLFIDFHLMLHFHIQRIRSGSSAATVFYYFTLKLDPLKFKLIFSRLKSKIVRGADIERRINYQFYLHSIDNNLCAPKCVLREYQLNVNLLLWCDCSKWQVKELRYDQKRQIIEINVHTKGTECLNIYMYNVQRTCEIRYISVSPHATSICNATFEITVSLNSILHSPTWQPIWLHWRGGF